MGQSKVLYSIGRVVCTPIFKALYRYKLVNGKNIPKKGGYIVACNHISYSDPVLLGICQKRRIFYMAKDTLFSNKFFGALIRALGAFPVTRGAGDGKAIKNGEDIINDGNVMGIFIEGGRSKDGKLLRPRSGCALVAQQTGVPVIPACITKVGRGDGIFSKRVIHFASPITPRELGLKTGDRRELKNASNIIMDKIREMREQDLNEYKNR